jgi:predicted nicotinamide N-methyase
LNDSKINFLATQVWPSSRLAAAALQKYMDPAWVVCEFGCGPGLPSLAAAKLGATRVVATDIDSFALELVEEAAAQQRLANIETSYFDLTANKEPLPTADLYLLSDVFESGRVARGAAHFTDKALDAGARVWVFAQTDRAQRDDYLKELCLIRNSSISWNEMDDFDGRQALWLCNIDETAVNYG